MSAAGMFTLVRVELIKLRRSLALLLCLAAPASVALLSFLIALDGTGARSRWSGPCSSPAVRRCGPTSCFP